MIDDWYKNNLAKVKFCAVFHHSYTLVSHVYIRIPHNTNLVIKVICEIKFLSPL